MMPLGGNKVDDSSSTSEASSSKKSRRRQKASASPPASTVIPTGLLTKRRIEDLSKNVFATATPGFLPPAPFVAELRRFLDALTLKDVALDASMSVFRATNSRGEPKVTYLHFVNRRQFMFGVFCLPRSAVIPLHDHPGMTVFSKILLGSMHIRSYDWVKPKATRASDGARKAKLKTDAVFDTSSETAVLYPEDGGNLHCFTAMTPCAVLDVMGPPYCSEQGRDCSYYRIVGSEGQHAWLKEERCAFKVDAMQM